ncbi:uncharacterized protein LOC125202382 [Salvia hispanica]|uniref:uncharacterized protein LOC125202382 n=1 Tax=Salvia hispanica TaxID=49212 RepID=UPI002009173F|nr:uncharacterized protein LOC125202382 [Salvia hispanica]
MACNKDEAIRAKGIAENLLLERDILGAKKLALKAHSLFPELDGVSQFLEIIDVYVAHEKKINGVSDYYGMFGVDPLSDEEIIKKQYKRMALFLHPDKNKSVGAAGAFQIISEAWGVLRDKDKRSEYDLKVNIRSSNQTARFSTSNFQQSPPFSNSNGQVHNFQNNAHPTFPAQYIPTPKPPFSNSSGPSRRPMTSSSSFFRPDTFWTLCNGCNVHYEYTNIFLNQTLLCRRCRQPFLATAIPDPPVHSRSSRPRPFPNQQQEDMHAAAQPSASRTSQAPSSHTSKKQAKRRHETPINMERENGPSSVPEKAETASASHTASPVLNKERPAKRRRKDGQKCDDPNEGSQGIAGSGVYVKKASADAKGKFVAEQPRSTRELSQRSIRAMLIGKAKTEIRNQLNEWEKEKVTSSLSNGQDTGNVVHASSNNSKIHPEINDEPRLEPLKSSTFKETVVEAKPDDFVSMSVPDANFHNFDDGRVENSFANNQVWAAYDDDDGMPRYYAMIHRVISRIPFKMQISWLNSKSTSEFGSLDWVASGFTKTTGNFRAGKFVVSERLNSFSHPVKWKKGLRGVIHILPIKGEVWALYRNWSADWDENTPDETIHKYDLVVVLKDYNEDTGVLVAPLVKVAGFTSVFNQLPDQRRIKTIPRGEMFRFSHQVPFHFLNGVETENAPKNCYELDPAALPLELLNAITDVKSAEQVVADPGMLREPGLGNGTMTESCPIKAHTNQRRGVEDPKHVITYSRRNKGKKITLDKF